MIIEVGECLRVVQAWAERQGLQTGQNALCSGFLLSMLAACQAMAGSLVR